MPRPIAAIHVRSSSNRNARSVSALAAHSKKLTTETQRSRRLIFVSLCCLLLLFTPPAYPQQESQEEVIKLSTELVTLDAEVLDKKTGQPIAGLTAEDFELYEDGVRQQISH